MARVNHKLVKQRLNEKRSSITDRQFFSSRILAGHFEDMAEAHTRRYHYNRRVRVSLGWQPADRSFVARTDNQIVQINAGHEFVTGIRGRPERYQIVCGLFTHELGHVLYTDFLAIQTYMNFLAVQRWYPSPPPLKTSADIRNETALWEYSKADKLNMEALQAVAHKIDNILEDGYVENRMLNNFPGSLGYGLETVRARQFETMPTVTQLIEEEESGRLHIFESIMQVMLSYAKYGEIKYGDEPLSDIRIQTVFGLLDDIDRALTTRSAKERLCVVSLILVRCWEYIREYCEICKERLEEAREAGEESGLTETIAKALEKLSGSSSMGSGSTSAVLESAGADPSSTEDKRAATKSAAGKEKNAESEESDTDSGCAESDHAGENESDESASGTSEAKSAGSGGGGSAGKQETTSEEGGRIPLVQTDSVSEPVGGTVERNDAYEREKYDRAASDIERVLDKMAEKAACTQLENERIRELNEAAQNISYGNIHSGVNVRINRIADVDEELVEAYQTIAPPLLDISKQLQKSLLQKLKEERRGGKQTGLLMGRRLDTHALHRGDGKVFYKNALPNEIPELAVGLLLDESGSMSCGDRSSYARAAAIILYDFCQALNIPVLVYGHSTGGYGDLYVELYSYAEFDSFDRDDKYRLMDIAARENNRDGASLRYVAEQLSKRPETVKILISVSDGQPADYGYVGTAAEEDLRGIKREYQRKGILFVAAAIGNDKQNIERIYGDSFLDITDLKQLPVKLTTVVKRHIRV